MATLTDPTGRGRKARTITATDPATGATFDRRTDRLYVAAVVVDDLKGQPYAVAWAGRPDLAAKALAQRGGAANGYRLAPVTSDPWATPEATPAPASEAAPAAQVTAAPRPTLPGEATPPPAPAALGDAAPTLPPLPVAAPADRVAAHRAAAPTGDPLEGQPWDPGTPEARARVADQGRIAARLHPIARAATGAGCTLPPSWWSDGPALNGELPPMRALEALPLPTLAAAAAALAALPPVTEAQAQGLAYCRAALRARSARL